MQLVQEHHDKNVPGSVILPNGYRRELICQFSCHYSERERERERKRERDRETERERERGRGREKERERESSKSAAMIKHGMDVMTQVALYLST